MKSNLYLETVKILEENNKSLKDILWIGTKEATIDPYLFFKEAKKREYDIGYGGIATDIIIVGSNWWLSREEYDGAEWWAYNSRPQRSKTQRTKFDLRGATLFER